MSTSFALWLRERITVFQKGGHQTTGKLIAFDDHFNLLLQDCVEMVVKKEAGDETSSGNPSETSMLTRQRDFLWIRGDGVLMATILN